MTTRVLLLISVITALIIYLSIGGFDNLTKQSFNSFYKSEKKENFILDLDSRSNQPFVFRGTVLIFNGEIYNFLELNI